MQRAEASAETEKDEKEVWEVEAQTQEEHADRWRKEAERWRAEAEEQKRQKSQVEEELAAEKKRAGDAVRDMQKLKAVLSKPCSWGD